MKASTLLMVLMRYRVIAVRDTGARRGSVLEHLSGGLSTLSGRSNVELVLTNTPEIDSSCEISGRYD